MTLWPSGFFTVRLTVAPADPGGVVAMICVELVTVTEAAGVVPNVTVAPAWKFAPPIVTWSPPAGEPVVGETGLIVGAGATNVNALERLAVWPSGLVTVTLTGPGVPGGVVA